MSLLFLSARLSRKLSGRFFPLGATRFPRSGFSGRFRLLLLHVCLGALARRWPACDRPRGWHPDRETDPKERDRKTKLMQRVNEAYNKNNLLQLLELQLELEHIDQHSINSLSEDRLKHYNKILKEQVRELDQEIEHVETAPLLVTTTESIRSPYFPPARSCAILPRISPTSKVSFETVSELCSPIEDVQKLKLWLKARKLVPAAPAFDPF